MKPILDASNPLELNALFIQPTRWCGLNCKGCYVKEHTGGAGDTHLDWSVLSDLFTKFYFNKDGAWANQITIAVDDLSEDPEQAKQMSTLIIDIISRLKISSDVTYPEVHMTFHTMDTITQYAYYLGQTVNHFWKHLDMVSLSVIRDKDLPWIQNAKFLYSDTMVNYNHLVPSNVTSFNIDKYVDHLTKVGELVDHIYMVMFKTPVGGPRNELTKLGDVSRMETDIAYMNTILERVPDSVRRKITIDGCLQDTIKHSKTGFGCSSNVSRVQVWPDGSVTGCPYAHSSTGPGGSTVEDILVNIARARREYDFRERCHLPDVYDTVTNRRKNPRLKIQGQ